MNLYYPKLSTMRCQSTMENDIYWCMRKELY